MSTQAQVTQHFDADVETVFALVTDPEFIERSYAGEGARDIEVTCFGDPDGGLRIVSRRKVTVDLPGFAKRMLHPTNTIVQTDEWSPATADGQRICRYTLEVEGVPTRIVGTLSLVPDGAGTSRRIVADLTVSIPLIGGRLERFGVDSGQKVLERAAEFLRRELATL